MPRLPCTGRAGSSGAVAITDSAPLVGPLSAYTITKSAPFADDLTNLRQQGGSGTPVSLQSGGVQPVITSGGAAQSQFSGGIPSGLSPQGQQPPNNPVIGFLITFWWLIPVAIVVSAACGIWYERSRRRRRDLIPEHGPAPAAWNTTVVQKSAEQTSPGLPVNEYAIRLPAALEKKYPVRNILRKAVSPGSSMSATRRTTGMPQSRSRSGSTR